MSTPPTQALLAIYLGETYVEIEVRLESSAPTKKTKNESVAEKKKLPVFKKNYFLPQSSLKTTLNQVQKQLTELNIQINNVYVVCRYLDKLKTFRLGGSVVQVVHRGFENSYVIENTSRVSLAAAALVISVDQDTSTDFLAAELARIKKINPDANKVAIQLDENLLAPQDIQKIQNFFTEFGFKIFQCDHPQNLQHVRKTLLNAGFEGTKEEIISEFKENFKEARIHFWVKDQFQSIDSNSFENFDLYFSSQDFLSHLLRLSKKQNLIHFDLESWMLIGSDLKIIWDSPWGLIERPHYATTSMALHPLTEILIDETSRLQFSKLPANSEPGPMIAGRGVKSLLIDLFWNHIHENPDFKTLFPQLENPLLQTKIESQFKVLEKGQRSESNELTKSDLLQFVKELIDFELELKLGHPVSDLTETLWTGHLAQLANTNLNIQLNVNSKPNVKQNVKLNVKPKLKSFSWTENIFTQITTTQIGQS